jgi:hypothetical protein
MRVHVSELLTELLWDHGDEPERSTASAAEEAPAPLDRIRAAHDHLIRDRQRTCAEDFSD